MANRNLESLSLDDVQSLLTNLNMNNYKDSFLRNEIDGETLSAIESATEFADLGINIPAKANLLFKKVSTFKSGGVPIDLLTKVASIMSARADVDISRSVQAINSQTGKMIEKSDAKELVDFMIIDREDAAVSFLLSISNEPLGEESSRTLPTSQATHTTNRLLASVFQRNVFTCLKDSMESEQFVIQFLSALKCLCNMRDEDSHRSELQVDEEAELIARDPKAENIRQLLFELLLHESFCDAIAEILKIHGHTNDLVAELGLLALSKCLFVLGPISNESVCAGVVALLRQYTAAVSIAGPGLLVLALLTRNQENKECLISFRFGELLTALCSQHCTFDKAFESGMLAAGAVADDVEQCVQLAGAGMVSVCFIGLWWHWANANASTAALQCMNKLLRCRDSVAIPFEEELDLCSLIVKVLDAHVSDVLLSLCALDTIELLSGKFDCFESIQSFNFITENIEAITHAGVSPILCTVISAHTGLESVLTAAFRIILVQSMYSVESRSILLDCGVCDILRQVAISGTLSESLVELIFRIVVSLLTNNFMPIPSTKGLCNTLPQLLKIHARNDVIVGLGMSAIALLAENSIENKTILCSTGCCQVVIRLMRLNSISVAVIESGFNALAAIAMNIGQTAATTGSSGSADDSGVSTPTQKGNSPKQAYYSEYDPEVQGDEDMSSIASELHSSSPRENMSMELSPSGPSRQGLPSSSLFTFTLTTSECHEVIHLLRTYAWSASVVAAGLQSLRHLTANSAIKALLTRHGVTVAVVEVLKLHSSDVIIAEAGLWVINMLAHKSTSNNFSTANVSLKSAGAHSIVVSILHAHSSDVAVAEAGLRAINSLAANSVCRLVLANAGACATILHVLQLHVSTTSATPIIAKFACSTMLQLAFGSTTNATQLRVMGAKSILKSLIINNGLIVDEACRQKARDVIIILNKSL